MNQWSLPTSVLVAGVDWHIRTDYKIVLDVLQLFDSPDYDKDEKWIYCMCSLVIDFDDLPRSDYPDMCDALADFIDMGMTGDDKRKLHLMDWSQDAPLIIPEINKQIGGGVDVRSLDMHWWTFLGYYMGIGESAFATVVGIRKKRATGKKLEKWECEYRAENKSLVDLEVKRSKEELEEMARWNALLG